MVMAPGKSWFMVEVDEHLMERLTLEARALKTSRNQLIESILMSGEPVSFEDDDDLGT